MSAVLVENISLFTNQSTALESRDTLHPIIVEELRSQGILGSCEHVLESQAYHNIVLTTAREKIDAILSISHTLDER